MQEYWRLQAAAEKEALARKNVAGCLHIGAGGSADPSLFTMAQLERYRALRVKLLLAGSNPVAAPGPSTSKETMIPGDLVAATGRRIGFDKAKMDAAFANKSSQEDRCRVHAGLVETLLASPRTKA